MTALLDALMERPLTEDDLDQVGQALRDTGIHYELDDGRLLRKNPGGREGESTYRPTILDGAS